MQSYAAHPDWSYFQTEAGDLAYESAKIPGICYCSVERVTGIWYWYDTTPNYVYRVISELTAMILLRLPPLEARRLASKYNAGGEG